MVCDFKTTHRCNKRVVLTTELRQKVSHKVFYLWWQHHAEALVKKLKKETWNDEHRGFNRDRYVVRVTVFVAPAVTDAEQVKNKYVGTWNDLSGLIVHTQLVSNVEEP